MRLLTSVAALAFLASSSIAMALQTLSVRPDGEVRITASTSGVTRVSVDGDRIRRLIHEDSLFETMNDGDTGDVYLRYSGPHDKLVSETGYIITEAGHTIAYTITPKLSSEPETVKIKLVGVETSATSGGTPSAGSDEGFEFPTSSGSGGVGGGDGYASQLVAFTRSLIDKEIGGKAAPNRSHGASVSSFAANGLRGRVLVASGGKSGRYVRPQEFYREGVLAVWVERNSLGPRESAWVVVVEAKK